MEHYVYIVWCALDADADVACWVAVGRLWTSLHVAVVAIVDCGGFVHLGLGDWVWCAGGPWPRRVSDSVCTVAHNCHSNSKLLIAQTN